MMFIVFLQIRMSWRKRTQYWNFCRALTGQLVEVRINYGQNECA